VDTFVPNDVRLVGGRGTSSGDDDNMTGSDDSEDQEGKARSIVVCTGANACGKVFICVQVFGGDILTFLG
jgi:DNA mismatch repair protein MSH5